MTILYCPVGPQELDLIREANWSRFPPRLPEQPIFYPVLNEEYARQIARYWNVKASGAGLGRSSQYLAITGKGFDVHVVGGFQLAEYWMPAEQLDEFNQNILGIMDVVAEFRPERSSKEGHRLRVYAHLLANGEIFLERKGSIEATIVALWQAPHGLGGHRHFGKDLPQPGAKDQRSLIEHYGGIPLA